MATVLRFPDRVTARQPAEVSVRRIPASIVILPCIRRETLVAKQG
ncbi:hypothetical protein [Aureimonas psammosilenae]|nr:hypothetical protein [Aureimonas psammosilenae]